MNSGFKPEGFRTKIKNIIKKTEKYIRLDYFRI